MAIEHYFETKSIALKTYVRAEWYKEPAPVNWRDTVTPSQRDRVKEHMKCILTREFSALSFEDRKKSAEPVEQHLFESANSLFEYMDMKTMPQRIRDHFRKLMAASPKTLLQSQPHLQVGSQQLQLPPKMNNKGFPSFPNHGFNHLSHKKPVQSMPTLKSFVVSKSLLQDSSSSSEAEKATTVATQGPARSAQVTDRGNADHRNVSSDEEKEWEEEDGCEEEADFLLSSDDSSEASVIEPAVRVSSSRAAAQRLTSESSGGSETEPLIGKHVHSI